MKLKNIVIPDWRTAWRFLSVQIALGMAFLDIAYEHLFIAQQFLPEHWVRWAALILIAGRIVQQKPPPVSTHGGYY